MKNTYSLLFLVLVGSASAQTIVDQEFPAWNSVAYYLDYPGDYMAQTFTIQNSGRLTNLGIRVGLGGYSHYSPPIDDLLVRLVRTGASGAPVIDQVIASRIYHWREVPQFSTSTVNYLEFNLTDWQIPVLAGEVLAIALSSNQAAYSGPGNTYLYNHHNYDWHTSFGDPHPGGDFYLYSPNLFGPEPHKWQDRWTDPTNPPFPSPHRDMGFRVLVQVPEPASIVVAACAIALLATRRSSIKRAPSARGIRGKH